MANILIIDDQTWIKDLCREGLSGEAHNVLATDNIEAVVENVLDFNPHIVLLNQYLKRGFLVWDVLQGIKLRHPDLPVLIVTKHDTHLYDFHLSKADGYLVKSPTAADELRQKISDLLGRYADAPNGSQIPSPI